MKEKLLSIGIIGTIITVLCCFTPVLIWILPAIGLTATLVYLDYFLLPAMAIFIFVTGFALWRRQGQ